jgi:membrane associated rhomboid family serine protease
MERGEALARARALFLRGEGDLALRTLDGDALDADLLALRASIRFYQGERAESKKDADRALDLDPRSTEARLVRARLLEAEDLNSALREASAILEIDPGHAPAAYWRGVWRAQAGRTDEAKEDLGRAARAEGDEVRTCHYRGLARLALGDGPGAVKDLTRAEELGMTLPGLYWARAQAKSIQKDRKGAIEDLGRAIGAGSAGSRLYLDRGRERLLDGDRAGAIADFDRAIELDPGSTASYYLRGKARQSSDPLEAQRDFVRACATDPSDADGFFSRGLAKEEAERYGQVMPDLTRALELAPFFHPRREEFEKKLKAGPRRRPRSILDREHRPWLSFGVGAVCVAVWLLQGDPFSTPDGVTLLERGAVSRFWVRGGEYWRLLTAVFLHIGPIHLLWNLYGGMSWCVAVERTIGPARFLAAYLLSGIAASATSVICHDVVSAGASGALFGMIGAVLALYYVNLRSWSSFFAHREVRSILTNIGVWTVLGLTMMKMDNYAHFGGLAFGALFGWLFVGVPRLSLFRRVASWGIVVSALLAVILGACLPRPSSWANEDRPFGELGGSLPESQARAMLEDLDETLRDSPPRASTYIARGSLRLRVGRVQEGIQDLRKATELLEPGDPHREALRHWIRLLEMRRP